MEALQEYEASCPYCGEPITLLMDLSAGSQSYIEDCQVCCRPISISMAVEPDGTFSVSLRDEDSAG
ncbi:CPXCG motif-containing cysteine-rich protein [Microbulbifer sediminum]|uniref:CPXCG motif-containing cysteine-rich protein n=1 Tax=Microbulbifer sediminum TaxID=2904250 RepID=UPI001F241C84|nr:CPXCG motif-containing cysteine-rich protein [Microbulbifer sediminum]